MKTTQPFKWRHFQAQIILLCVRWYLRYPLSYRQLEEIMLERGLSVDLTTIYRWVQAYALELEKRCRPYLKQTNDSWKVDETYIRVKGKWLYLFRAVDSNGETIDFLLSKKRDLYAAQRLFRRALGAQHNPQPREINADKSPNYPSVVEVLKKTREISMKSRLRPIRYLNNLIDKDHRFIKRRVNPMLGFSKFKTARNTLYGIEAMNMIRKRQIISAAKEDVISQVEFINEIFEVAA